MLSVSLLQTVAEMQVGARAASRKMLLDVRPWMLFRFLGASVWAGLMTPCA